MKKSFLIFLTALAAVCCTAPAEDTEVTEETGDPTLSIEGETVLKADFEEGVKYMKVVSNTSWWIKAEDEYDWLTIEPKSGKGTSLVKFSVRENKGDSREAYATVHPTMKGPESIKVQLVQEDRHLENSKRFPFMAWTGCAVDEWEMKGPIMKECGIDIYLGWYENLTQCKQALELAEKYDIKVITSCPELLAASTAGSTVKALKDYPALYGYHIKDEPSTGDFDALATQVNRIRQTDETHPTYINLYPIWCFNSPSAYSSHVATFLNKVYTEFISFDIYPIFKQDGVYHIRENWYHNLEIIYAACKRSNLPMWAFALVLSHNLGDITYPVPSENDLRLQFYSNLAYGAQMIQLFTLHGICLKDSKMTAFSRARNVIAEVQGMADIFVGCNVEWIRHTGDELPEGTIPLTILPSGIKSLKTGDSGATVSYLTNGKYRYLMLVNRSLSTPLSVKVEADNGVDMILPGGHIRGLKNSFEIDRASTVLLRWQESM